MGLFSKLFYKRKEEEETKERVKPPRFSSKLSEQNFPSYEPTFPFSLEEIKKSVQAPAKSLEKKPLEEKEIFVKIESYKEAIDILEVIKEKLKTAQVILNEMKDLKKKEEAEFEEWQNKIDVIKEKLKLVNNNLFSV